MGAFTLLPVEICALPHMGVKFPNYTIMCFSLNFGWAPSPASRGAFASLLLHYVASRKPNDAHFMGPGSFAPYDYGEDGTFADHWPIARPWVAVAIRVRGFQTCVAEKALHVERKADGTFTAALGLWGLNLCDETEIISPPSGKLVRSQEFLGNSAFGPGVTMFYPGRCKSWEARPNDGASATPLWRLGYMVDKLLRSYVGLSPPPPCGSG